MRRTWMMAVAAAALFLALFGGIVWLQVTILSRTWEDRLATVCAGCIMHDVNCTRKTCDGRGMCNVTPGVCWCPDARDADQRCPGDDQKIDLFTGLVLFMLFMFVLAAVLLCMAAAALWQALRGLEDEDDTHADDEEELALLQS